MLTLITGAPRSGKTYYAVDYINQEFKKHKKNISKYRYIITNINGLNYEHFEGFVKQYNKADFESSMQQEFQASKQNDNGEITHDGDYDKWCIDNHIYANYHHCLIVVDEAYNVFTDKFEDYKGRFLSYHGHFGIDILFLIQSKRQTNRQYIVHTEITIVAQPSGKRILQKNFRYKHFSTSDTRKDNEIETTSLRFNQDVANLYNSGSTQIYKSFVGKRLLIILVLSMLFYFWFFVLKPPTYSDSNETITNETIVLNDSRPNISSKINYDLGFSFLTICYEKFCRFDGYTLNLNEQNMFKLLSKYECEIFIHESISHNIQHYYLSCNPNINDFLNPHKEIKNEKIDSSSSKYL